MTDNMKRAKASNAQGFDHPDLTLEDMFRRWPETATVFFNHNMRCVGCPIVAFHKVSDACEAYGLNPNTFKSLLRKAAAPPSSGISPDPLSSPSGGDPSP